MVRDQRDLEIQLPLRLRERRHQREAFGDGVEDERREPHLGGHAQAGDAARLEDPRAHGARDRLQYPGQREAGADPEQRHQPLRGHHFRQQMEGDHARRGGEGEGARPLQHRRPLARHERDGPAQQRGKERESRRADHAWQLRHSPRSSSRWPSTR